MRLSDVDDRRDARTSSGAITSSSSSPAAGSPVDAGVSPTGARSLTRAFRCASGRRAGYFRVRVECSTLVRSADLRSRCCGSTRGSGLISVGCGARAERPTWGKRSPSAARAPMCVAKEAWEDPVDAGGTSGAIGLDAPAGYPWLKPPSRAQHGERCFRHSGNWGGRHVGAWDPASVRIALPRPGKDAESLGGLARAVGGSGPDFGG